MAKLGIILIVCVAVLVPVLSDTAIFLTDGRSLSKILRIQEQTRNLAISLRKLQLNGPSCFIKLSDMANEITFSVQAAIYDLNQAIPTTKNKKLQSNLADVTDSFTELAHNVQRYLHKDPEKLKECLAVSFEVTGVLAGNIADILASSECKNEIFISNQLRRTIAKVIYAAKKLHYQVEYFHKTNKELEGVIDETLEDLCKTLHNIKGDNAKAREELIHQIQYTENAQKQAIDKLEGFMHVNIEDVKIITIVKDVSLELGASCLKYQQLAVSNHELAKLVTEAEELYRASIATMKKLLKCEVGENTVGELFLRSILFDAITLSKVFEKEINSCLTD